MIILKTDFVGVVFLIIYILFISAIMITPSVLTFLFYKWAKNKHKLLKIISLCLFVGVTLFMSYQSFKLITEDETETFGPKYETVEIPQKVGGVIVCKSVYTADFHSWDYDINYSYKINDSIYDLGNGRYGGENWEKDEQFVLYDKWLILKVSNERDADKLIIFDNVLKSAKEYIISPEMIESESIWKSANIKTRLNNWDTVAKIKKINNNGTYTVMYRFRKGEESLFRKNDKREIVFEINKETGVPKMTEIKII